MIDYKMTNFTVGPVQSSEKVKAIGAENTPYFRTPEFSEIMLENERLILKFTNAPAGARCVFITGSSTASMEAVVMNTLDEHDKALVVNGGSFGERFCQICAIHKIPYTAIKLEPGHALKKEHLAPFEGQGYTAFLVNIDETSTAVLYDIDLISDFCRRNGLFFIVDAVSSFMADPLDLSRSGVDVMITGSQKALAVPPGISLIVLGQKALERVERIDSGCMYLDLKSALKNGERGQTPFTPAVTILLQIHQRLREVEEAGGIETAIAHSADQAADFRERVQDLPFDFFSESFTNAVTSLKTRGVSAKKIFTVLKDEYGIWICPNGGDLAESVFRVGHMGELTHEDNARLIEALKDLQKRGII